MPFTNDKPEGGADQLRKWAWDVVEYREGIELPEKLDLDAVEFLLSHLDFMGERFLYAVHFALCAVAKEEMTESEYEEFWIKLDESIRKLNSFPRLLDHGLFPLIATGLQRETKTVCWLPSPGKELAWKVIRAVLPGKDLKLIRALDKWLVEQGESPGEVEKNYYQKPTAPAPDEPKDEPEWNTENVETDIERCRVFLNLLKRARESGKDLEKRESWLNKIEERLPGLPKIGINDDRGIEIEKDFLIETWATHRDVDLEKFEGRMLNRYTEGKDDPDVECFEVEGIMGDLCEVWVATGNYKKFFDHIEKLDTKGSLWYVTQRLFEHWVPEKDIPEILQLCDATAEKYADDDDASPPYQIERMLCDIVFELSRLEQRELARQTAEHLQNTYDEDSGFENIATWHVWRGNYTKARELGGGSPDSYRCPAELKKDFLPGTDDDVEALDYYKSVKNWQNIPNVLTSISLHGGSREAVTHLIRMEIKTSTAGWLHNSYYENDPSCPRDYQKLCELTKENAADSIRYKVGPDARSPIEFRLFRIIIGTLCGFINLLIYRNWRGKQGESDRRESKDEAKERKCHEAVTTALGDADKEADQGRRILILEQATSRLHYVDRWFSDRYIEAPDLQGALRAEFSLLRQSENELREHDAASLWQSLSKALLETGDIPGAAEALQEREKYYPVDPLFSKQLVDKVDQNSWHLVAPFCSTNPLSATVLAEKLEIWNKDN